MRFRVPAFFLTAFGLVICSCDLSDTRPPDTLTFRLDDSLKTASGKYDSVRLDLYTVSGRDTAYAKTLFHGLYADSSQLRDLPMGRNLDGSFLIRLTAYRKGKPALEVGVPFAQGKSAQEPIVYRAPVPDSQATGQDSNGAPRWKSASVSQSGKEGEPMGLDLSALYLGDADGDPVTFSSSCGSVDVKTLHWTFTPGFRDAGKMECEILATDAQRPPATGKLILRLDIADSARPVDVAIVSPLRGSFFRDSLVVVRWKVGEQWQSQDTLEILRKEGPNLIRRTFRDSAGQVGADSIVIFRDTEAPLAPIVSSGSDTLTNNPRPSWTWKSGGKGGAGVFRYKLGDTVWAGGGQEVRFNSYRPDSSLPEGSWVLNVEEKDSAGNWSATGRCKLIIDLTPPARPRLTANAFHTLNPKPVWRWSSGGNGGAGIFRFKLDDANLDIGSTTSNAVSFTPSIGFASGTRHTLYLQERDAAGNWSEPASYGVRVHGQTGYVVGDSGTILKTTNGGANWDTLPRLGRTSLKSAWFLDINTGFLAGDSGKILRTSIGGPSLSLMKSGTTATLNSLCFLSDKLGYAATESGELRMTIDGGEIWNLVSKPTSYGIAAISFSDSINGLAVGGFSLGARGFMLSTKDGGRTWSHPVDDAPYALAGVTYVTPDKAFAVGNHGAILASSDSGRTWKEIPSGTSNFLTAAFFVTEEMGFVTGENGTILKTTDGGQNWISLTTGTQRSLSSVYFTDEKTGYASGAEAAVLRTLDGGESWFILRDVVTYGGIGPRNTIWIVSPNFSSIYFP